MNKKHIFPLLIVVAVFVALAILLFFPTLDNIGSDPRLDAFAQCLAEKNVTMYGAEWCSHCQDQKRLFGSSFEYVPYVECPENTNVCIEKGVEGYPTWILSDGKKLVGKQELDVLARESGCEFSK